MAVHLRYSLGFVLAINWERKNKKERKLVFGQKKERIPMLEPKKKSFDVIPQKIDLNLLHSGDESAESEEVLAD